MVTRPPITTRPDPPFPYTPLFRSLRALRRRHQPHLDRVGAARGPGGGLQRAAARHVGTCGLRTRANGMAVVMEERKTETGPAVVAKGDRKSTRLNSSH